MKAALKQLTTVAGIVFAIGGAGPGAAAAQSSASGGTPLAPGLSCSVNQGLPPGVPNVGPTGPLGPLGPYGPLGGGGGNLPCGASALNLGPSGPLGPGGALGSAAPGAQATAPASQSSPATHPAGKHGAKKHAGRGRSPRRSRAGHGHAPARSRHAHVRGKTSDHA